MDLFTLCTANLRHADLQLYQRLENEWCAEQRAKGIEIGPSLWVVQPRRAGSAGTAESPICVPIEYRAWAVWACLQLYMEWRAAEIGDSRQIDSRYRTLRDWMSGQLYGVFPSDDSDGADPFRMTYGQWLRYGLDVSFQQALFGKVVVRSLTGQDEIDVVAEDEWALFVESLIEIAGRLTIRAGLEHLPNPQLDAPGSYRDIYLRGRALRFAQRVFPEWIGRTVPTIAEKALLGRLYMHVQNAEVDDLVALEWYGLSLSIDLSDHAWSAARMLINMERRRRSQGPEAPKVARFRIVPEVFVN